MIKARICGILLAALLGACDDDAAWESDEEDVARLTPADAVEAGPEVEGDPGVDFAVEARGLYDALQRRYTTLEERVVDIDEQLEELGDEMEPEMAARRNALRQELADVEQRLSEAERMLEDETSLSPNLGRQIDEIDRRVGELEQDADTILNEIEGEVRPEIPRQGVER